MEHSRGFITVRRGGETLIEYAVNSERDNKILSLPSDGEYEVTYTHNRDGDDGAGFDITATFGYIVCSDERPDEEFCWNFGEEDVYFVKPYAVKEHLYVMSDDPETVGPVTVHAKDLPRIQDVGIAFGVMMTSYR